MNPYQSRITHFCFNAIVLNLVCAVVVSASVEATYADECSPDDPDAGVVAQSPDFSEPIVFQKGGGLAALSGPIAPASGQPTGALSGRIVFTSGGHGWTASTAWGLQRPVLLEMNEDYGNLDQMNFFALYCFNAGATVVPMRPIGNQTNEVVLDNDDAAVTYVGSWSDSASTIYFGSPGDVAYRFASLAATETATATYTPTIPASGFYPVYTWVRHGSDRTSQLYRIRHTGGESSVRVPHHMIGNGWIYLGTYHFNAGSNATSGAVIISNLQPSPTVGSVVIADAIRFGNGMGSVDRGFGVSTYPREEEASRYWVEASIGQGQSPTIYDPDYPTASTDDQTDNVGAPPRMAVEMNREAEGNIHKRIFITFHSNATTGDPGTATARGTLALYNSTVSSQTPNQVRLAEIAGQEVNNDLSGLSASLELPWNNRGLDVILGGSFGEINNSTITDEFDATLIEVAFHDNTSDSLLMRDPKARNWVGRASYQAVVRYMNEFDAAPLTFLPEPPANVRVASSGSNMVVNWSASVAQGGSGAPTGYLVYQSTNGYGFGNPVSTTSTSFTFTNVSPNTDMFFRIAATNSGGQSFPSETVACRRSTNVAATKALIVNAFDRFERSINPRQTPASENYKPPGHNINTGTMDRVLPRMNNSFDYVVAHALAVGAAGLPYDSCQNEAVSAGTVTLGNYPIVAWACGQESTLNETFSSAEQTVVTTFNNNGGSLFVSGSDIAWDLDRAAGPTSGDRTFLNNILRADLVSDANGNAGSYTTAATAGAIFAGHPALTFDSGTNGIYGVRTPDILTPVGTGATKAINYGGGSSGAAIQYDGSAGGGRVVYFGFPFETITSASLRTQYMTTALNFLSLGAATNVPPSISIQPQGQFVVQGSNSTLSVTAAGSLPLSYQWRLNGTTLAGASSNTYTISNAQPIHSGNYSVVASNAYGMATSQVALIEIILPPAQTLFADNFDVNTSANWTTNRSSTDTRITFNWDYSLIGISSAPNSVGGTTRGLRLEANLSNTLTAAVSVSPIGQNFGGNYRLRFDMWINANGPFPAGGNGSTEHLTAGVGTTGNNVQWNTGSADGVWFAADGEGQATDTSATLPDWRAYISTILQQTNSGVWLGGNEPNVRGNFHPYYASTFPSGQTPPAFQQSNFPQQNGLLAVGTVGFAWRDVIINKTNNTVEWSIDGLKIAAITNATLTASNIFVGYWDSFTSLSDNTNLSFGLVDNVRVERFVTNVPPYITAQPQGSTAPTGSNVPFNITAGGTAALAYQWRFNGTNIAGANSSSYTRLNAQVVHAGNYSVVVTNVSGSVTSSVAALTLTPTLPLQFTSIARLLDGRVTLGINGEAGFNVQLRTSTNLTTWSVLTNLSNPSGSFSFTDAPPVNVLNQFYRALYP